MHFKDHFREKWVAILAQDSWEGAAARGQMACWVGAYTLQKCCAAHWGPRGNPACWLGEGTPFTHERCCTEAPGLSRAAVFFFSCYMKKNGYWAFTIFQRSSMNTFSEFSF